VSDLAISNEEFEALRKLIYRESGIALSSHKRPLLCSRLARRLRALGLRSYGAYYRYIQAEGPAGTELRELINCITTNKTAFFREPHHFDFLRQSVLAPLVRNAGRGAPRKLRVWSAACSTGEEPYSIAITVAEMLRPLDAWDVRILASDIDTQVLARAQAGRYPLAAAEPVRAAERKSWLKQVDTGHCEVHPALRQRVTFRQINFVRRPWPIRTRFDVIFCRNVMIYFDQATQARIYEGFHELLNPEGFLVAGHSENLRFMAEYFEPAGMTVYRRKDAVAAERSRNSGSRRSQPVAKLVGAARAPGARSAARANVSRSASNLSPSKPLAPNRVGLAQRSVGSDGVLIARARIHSGELFASDKPAVVATLLGSCVAACLYDPASGIGGMNHFMLPAGSATDGFNAVCFGVNAMELLINDLLRLGAQRSRLRAHAFGASRVLDGRANRAGVSTANARFVTEFLARENIPLESSSLGGDLPLLVEFTTHTGHVVARPLGDELKEQIVQEEFTFESQFERPAQASADNVVLF
jgi:chemotaxis protein methyltransferase CheR